MLDTIWHLLDKRIPSDTKICSLHCEKCFHVIVVIVSDKLSIYLRGRTGVGRSVSPLQVYISQSTWCTQPQQYRGWTVHLYSDLTITLRQSSSQVFIFLLLLVPMNLINTCKENKVTFLAASAPYHQDQEFLTRPVNCDVLAPGYHPLKVTNEGHLGTVRPGLWRRLIARIRHHLQTKFTTNVHTTSKSHSQIFYVPVCI